MHAIDARDLAIERDWPMHAVVATPGVEGGADDPPHAMVDQDFEEPDFE